MRRLLVALLMVFWPFVAFAGSIRLIDAAGRAVELSGPARHIALADALDVLTLSAVLDDPVAPVVGWGGADRLDENLLSRLRTSFPTTDAVVPLGMSPSELSAEAVIAARPDLLVAGGGTLPSDPVLARIAEAGIPTLFIFPPPGQRGVQGRDVETAIFLLGEVLGAQEKAARFNAVHKAGIDRIRDRVRDIADRPLVLVEAHAGSRDCCWSPGADTDYIEFVGGRNLGASLAGIEAGRLSLEFIIASDPAVAIGTGGVHMRAEGGLVLGEGVTDREAAQSLRNIMQRPGFDMLTAVRAGRVHGIWHQLLGTPWDLVALEAMARWIHPERFSDIDPMATLADINQLTSMPHSGSLLVEPEP